MPLLRRRRRRLLLPAIINKCIVSECSLDCQMPTSIYLESNVLGVIVIGCVLPSKNCSGFCAAKRRVNATYGKFAVPNQAVDVKILKTYGNLFLATLLKLL